MDYNSTYACVSCDRPLEDWEQASYSYMCSDCDTKRKSKPLIIDEKEEN